MLGYGNPGRRDDGLGPAAAEAIERRRFDGVRAKSAYQLMIDDAVDAAACERMIFIDAATAATEPFAAAPVEPAERTAAFASHCVSPALVLGLCRRLYGRMPDATLIGIRGYDFGFDEGLTPQAQANLEAAIAFVCELIERPS